MNDQNCEAKEEEVIDEGIGELEIEELVSEWGWRRNEGSLFQRTEEASRNERSVFRQDVGGRERVTTDEERVLYEDVEQRWEGVDGGRVVVRTL